MPNNYQNQETTNQVTVIGKVVEFDVRPTQNKDGARAMIVRGQIAVGSRVRVRFDKYIPMLKKDGSVRKDYQVFESAYNKIRTIQTVGEDLATVVELYGSLATNDRVNQQGQLVETLAFRPVNIRLDAPADEAKAEYVFEGFISHIAEEGEGLRVKVYGLDFRGDLIPLSFYVPSELKEVFENNYEIEQTSTFYIDYKALVNKPAATESTGIGIQRTSGSSRCGYVLVGADPARSPGEPNAIEPDAIREAGARRKAYLKDLEEKGYRGGATTRPRGSAMGIAPQAPIAASADDYDF